MPVPYQPSAQADVTHFSQPSTLYQPCAVIPQVRAQQLEEKEEVEIEKVACHKLMTIVVQEKNICIRKVIVVEPEESTKEVT